MPRGTVQNSSRVRNQGALPHLVSASRAVVCYVCQSKEQYANECPRKTSAQGSSQNSNRRKVELSTVNPVGTLTHKGEKFNFTFDSGSECSLLRQSVQDKFTGPVFETPVILHGIGLDSVTSTTQIVAEVVIDGNGLDVCFHVVPDRHIGSDIIVGREVLSMGVNITLTPEHCLFVPVDLNLSNTMKRKIVSIQNESTTTPTIDRTIPLEQQNIGHENIGHKDTILPKAMSGTPLHNNGSLESPAVVLPLTDKIVESVSHFDSDSYTSFDLTKIDTEIDGQHRPELLSILRKYHSFFTEHFPTTKVTTGELQIKLIDPHKIVSRRPYPLSPTDKQIVREHVALLEKLVSLGQVRVPLLLPFV